MRKNLLLLGLGIFFALTAIGQVDTTGWVNYLKNGDFEEKGAWKIVANDGDSTDVDWEFGVSPAPAYGEDGCLEVTWDNMSTPLNQLLYQVVQLTVGDTFYFDGAFWDFDTPDDINQAWFQIIIMPVVADVDTNIETGIAGPDWQTSDGMILLNHAKGWSVDWMGLGKNTTFVEDMNPDAIYGHNIGIGDFDGQGDTNIYIVPDTLFYYAPDSYRVIGKKGDKVDVFFALQVGQWMADGSGITNSFDFKFDSFVLLGPAHEPTAVHAKDAPEIYVFPNPVGNTLRVQSPVPVRAVQLYNLLGQEVRSLTGLNTASVTMNTSSLDKGVYILSVEDLNGNVHKEKIVKK